MRRPYQHNVFRLLLSVCLFAFSTYGWTKNSFFFVDTAGLLQVAIDAAYQKHPEIPEGGLVARSGDISLHCSPEDWWPAVNTASQEYPGQRQAKPQCQAHVSFLIRSTIKRDMVAASDGRCTIHREYETVNVHIYEDGTTTVSRGSGKEDNSGAECIEKTIELDSLVAKYRGAPSQQLDE